MVTDKEVLCSDMLDAIAQNHENMSYEVKHVIPMIDPIGVIANKTSLTRRTIIDIINASGKAYMLFEATNKEDLTDTKRLNEVINYFSTIINEQKKHFYTIKYDEGLNDYLFEITVTREEFVKQLSMCL
jgi:hypothetical protein